MLICVWMHLHVSILGLVLGEKVEVFAQRAGELGHLFAAVVGGARSVTLPLLYVSVDLHHDVCEVRVSGMETQPLVEFLDKPGSPLGVAHGCCAFERCKAADHVRPLR